MTSRNFQNASPCSLFPCLPERCTGSNNICQDFGAGISMRLKESGYLKAMWKAILYLEIYTLDFTWARNQLTKSMRFWGLFVTVADVTLIHIHYVIFLSLNIVILRHSPGVSSSHFIKFDKHFDDLFSNFFSDIKHFLTISAWGNLSLQISKVTISFMVSWVYNEKIMSS